MQPTPYSDVNMALQSLLASTQAVLGEHFYGMYLIGSLALGDFAHESSDIDYLVVTDIEITDQLFASLSAMHTRFDESGSPWAGKCEAVYVPLGHLAAFPPAEGLLPQLEKGTVLFRERPEVGWAFQCHTLREYGVAVAGPDPRGFVRPIGVQTLRHAVSAVVQPWMERREDPDWLVWLRAEGWSFVVLTLCRLLFTLESGDVASKPRAARWAQEYLGDRFRALIARSLAAKHDQRLDHDETEVVAFLELAAERCR